MLRTRRAGLIALNASDLSRDEICRRAHAGRLPSRPGPASRREEERAATHGARILVAGEADYPTALEELERQPPLLYVQGELPVAPAIAIVGSRDADRYGREVARHFARQLASAGLCIFSGCARGVDEAAHRGALESPGGTTVAVLGCGLDVDYPSRQGSLRREISERGAVITEFPFGTPPYPAHFPIRNRIIAALSIGTLVIQAADRSGSLVTARLALDLGRDVYAVPGRIDSRLARGCNTLIRDGAPLVQRPEDVLELLPMQVRDALRSAGPDASAEVVPAHLREVWDAVPDGEGAGADEIARRVEISIDVLLSHLAELEIGGWVQRAPGPRFARNPAVTLR